MHVLTVSKSHTVRAFPDAFFLVVSELLTKKLPLLMNSKERIIPIVPSNVCTGLFGVNRALRRYLPTLTLVYPMYIVTSPRYQKRRGLDYYCSI